MKRKIALFLSLIMLMSVLVPVHAFAQEETGLAKVISTVKSIVSIPKEYTEFRSEMNVYGGVKSWYLTWHSKDWSDGSMSVSIMDNGTITSYHHYRAEDYTYNDYSRKKFPKINRQEASQVAGEFIKKVNPSVFDKVKANDANNNSVLEGSYYFTYTRYENDIPFYSDNVNVGVNSKTGEVQNYYLNWTENLAIPSATGKISLREAQKAYKEKLGLKLIYNHTYQDDNIKVYPVYVPAAGGEYVIDAFSGEKVSISNDYYGPYYGDYTRDSVAGMAKSEVKEQSLTPEEIKEVDRMANYISQDEAEEIARDLKVLDLDGMKLENASLSRYWGMRDNYLWHLNFINEQIDEKTEYRYASVAIDASTSEIRSFWQSRPYKDGEEVKYNKDESKAAVEEFLKQFKPEKFDASEYDEASEQYYYGYRGSEQQRFYNFIYTRKVNGIPFPGNRMYVEFDAVSGKINNFGMEWFDIEFPELSNTVPMDKVYDTMFKEIGLELQYRVRYVPATEESGTAEKVSGFDPRGNREIKLVYAPVPTKPLIFDAITGGILDYNGNPYKENKPVEYSDIAGHYGEKQIKTLAEYGISFEGSEFRPNENITQLDFLSLLSKTFNYYEPSIKGEDDEKQIDRLYKFMIREGVIKADEKDPKAVMTREESVKLIIRALRYDKIAEIVDIFNCTFADKADINPELIGYVTIAQGLKIVSGSNGKFNPKGNLTRAQAAIVIYNYLQR